MANVILLIATIPLIAGCGGQTGNGTQTTNAGAGGGAATGAGGSSAGNGAGGSPLGGGAGAAGGPTSCSGATAICVPEGPSCAGGLTCAGGTSCCQSNVVSGGDFIIRSLHLPMGGQPPAVHVEPFALDVFHVTVGRFRAFVSAFDGAMPPEPGAGANPAVSMTGWRSEWNVNLPTTAAELRQNVASCPETSNSPGTWTEAPGDGETLPITCVTWFEAFAFCVWDGGRLPGNAEWEYAAAGGDENRAFPWGNGLDATRMRSACIASGKAMFTPVGAFPAGAARWGQLDMVGDAAHQAVFDCDTYIIKPQSTPCQGSPECACVGVDPFSPGRVLRGGSCVASPGSGGISVGAIDGATERGPGFRCARASK